MAEKEQVKPLAPAAGRRWFEIDEDDAISAELKQNHHRRYIKCCGCIVALLLIQVVVVLILAFTIFHVKDPKMKLDSVKVEGLDRVNNVTLPNNVSVIADISIKNPNMASFKFKNATIDLYYAGVVVGEALTPPGNVQARRTLRMNITVNINVTKMFEIPSFLRDLSSGALTMSSYSEIRGRVKILNVYKKQVVAKMNCTVTIDTNSQQIREQNCKGKVSI